MMSRRRSIHHPHARRAVAAATLLTLTVAISAACSRDSTSPDAIATHTSYGDSSALGAGIVKTYAVTNGDGNLTEIGVSLSDSAIAKLPATPPPGMPGLMINLALPKEANGGGFDHVLFMWNPLGHDPVQIYGAPHFDFHFYRISSAQQLAMDPADPQFVAKSALRPADQFVAASYIPLGAGVPFMGEHWGDTQAPELQPPPNNKPFTRTFLYGSYDGHFIFYEPMVTKTEIEASRTQSASTAVIPIKLPSQYETAGAYPTSYSVSYDASAKVYRVALTGLVVRK